MSLSRVMSQGAGALAANQTGLSTTSHNISNVNTKGYSRQTIEMQGKDSYTVGNVIVGGGVKVSSIERATSEFVNRRLESEKNSLGRLEGLNEVYGQLEQVFKDEGEGGITKSMSNFFNDVRTLSTQPESIALRSSVKESARAMVTQIHTAVGTVDEISADINRRIEGSVEQVNFLSKQISDLNQIILSKEIGGGLMANDERDKRDVAIQNLSGLVNVRVIPTDGGSVNIMADRLGPLVNGSENFRLESVRVPPEVMGGPGRINIMSRSSLDSPLKDVTNLIDNGQLAGLISAREQVIPKILNRLDATAHQLTNSVNEIHQKSFGLDGKSGSNFFEGVGELGGASRRFGVSSTLDNVVNLASATEPGAAGDNRGLLAIADLQDKKIFDNGKSSFTDFTAGTVGSLGVEIKSNRDALDTQQGIVAQLDVVRDQVAGVSLDEEAINMLKFQKAFDASAKLIQVADNMMDTVLSLKRF